MITSIFTTILLFMTGFGKKNKPINVNGNDKINKSNPDLVDKVTKKLKKINGNLNDGDNLKRLGDFAKIVTGSNERIKIDKVFVSLLSEMKDSIAYDNIGKIPIIHHNESIVNNEIEIYKRTFVWSI